MPMGNDGCDVFRAKNWAFREFARFCNSVNRELALRQIAVLSEGRDAQDKECKDVEVFCHWRDR